MNQKLDSPCILPFLGCGRSAEEHMIYHGISDNPGIPSEPGKSLDERHIAELKDIEKTVLRNIRPDVEARVKNTLKIKVMDFQRLFRLGHPGRIGTSIDDRELGTVGGWVAEEYAAIRKHARKRGMPFEYIQVQLWDQEVRVIKQVQQMASNIFNKEFKKLIDQSIVNRHGHMLKG